MDQQTAGPSQRRWKNTPQELYPKQAQNLEVTATHTATQA